MLTKVKMALRLTANTFDAELNDLIAAAYIDLNIAGVENVEEADPLIIRAVCTYCRMNFGSPGNYEQLRASYDSLKTRLAFSQYYNSLNGYKPC